MILSWGISVAVIISTSSSSSSSSTIVATTTQALHRGGAACWPRAVVCRRVRAHRAQRLEHHGDVLVVAVRHEEAAAVEHLARHAAHRPQVRGEGPARAEDDLGRAVVARLDRGRPLLVQHVVRRLRVAVRGNVAQLARSSNSRRRGIDVIIVIITITRGSIVKISLMVTVR